jgi:flagellar motor protein MotB
MRVYQRGVLLGLTLAELFILLIFIFLFSLHSVKKKEQIASGDLSNSNTTLGIAKPENAHAENKSFPIPDTPQELVSDGTLPEQIPPLGINDPSEVTNLSSVTNASNTTTDPASTRTNSNEVIHELSQDHEKSRISKEEGSTNLPGKHNWPPIITITEAEGYSFPTGSAVLSKNFEDLLLTRISTILQENISKYNANTIEVFGHTDEQPMSGRSNLDLSLIQAANGNIAVSQMHSADNVGLGMARAIAVVQVLSRCPELDGTTILPYSAGQVINESGSISTGIMGDDPSRRRIEIRLRGD